jgi:polysaccharide biosynthesis transport protein
MNETDAPAPNRSARSAHFYNHLHRYRNLLRKRWWVLPITILLGMAIQAVRLWNTPPSYFSVGRMIMSIKITTTTGTGTGFAEELSNFLGTQRELMLSARVRERAFERVRALKPALTPALVNLQISVSPKTTIFNLQAVGPEPEYTRAYLDACMEEYIALKSEMRASTSDTTLARIIEQLEGLDRNLKKYEEEETAFKTNNNIVFIREQVTSIASYLVQKNRLLDTYKNESELLTMLTLEQNLDRQKQRAALPGDQDLPGTAASLMNSDFLKARQELQLKKVELQEWSEILRPKHPRMIALNEEIARRENLLKIFKEQSREQLESQRDSLSLQTTNLVREIKELEIRSLDLSTKLSQYERILANKQNIQSLRDNLQRAMQSLGVEKDINPDAVTPLERASPARPARGSTVKAFIVAALLGLMGGLLVMFLVDRLDDRPTSFTDLQDMFDEPVMGQIPLEKEGLRSQEGLQLLQNGDTRHTFLEAYRNLRSSLLYMATQGQRPKVLVVTSAIPGDGKSMTTANLAITMASSGARVLLIDADLRKGLLHRRFGLEVTPGLSEALNGETPIAQAIVSTSYSNLFLLPRGNTSHDPGEMFLNPTTHRVIKDLAGQFDYLIFDTAPVMAADDVTSLAPHVEGVLFVIRAHYTSGRVARAALDLLYQREVNVLGLIFNGVQTHAGEYYYYRYKDYYGKRDGKHA